MGYLSEVEGGGATTFLVPNREVTVWPRRGSISFWFSLTKDGRRDMKTIHGGCPVLKGSKWIFNVRRTVHKTKYCCIHEFFLYFRNGSISSTSSRTIRAP